MMKTIKQISTTRVSNKVVALSFLAVLGLLFASMFLPHNHRGSDKAACIMNQRNIQQAVRDYAKTNSLDVGDAIDWSKIIGIGQYFEKAPACPIHGVAGYNFSHTIPQSGVLAAPCKNIEHKPSESYIKDW